MKIDPPQASKIDPPQVVALGVTLSELVDTTTDFGDNDSESWREVRILLEKLKGLDSKKRAVYLDAAEKLFERIESI